jgi:hypothetical protein
MSSTSNVNTALTQIGQTAPMALPSLPHSRPRPWADHQGHFRTKRKYTNQKKRVPAGVLIKYPQLTTIQEPDYYFTLTEKFTAAITEAEAKAEAHRVANAQT